MARVAMNGTIPPYAMSSPLTSPQPTPTSTAVKRMPAKPYSWVATVVAHTEERATIAPTDRSMPPQVMTKVMPTVTTPMTEAWVRTSWRLRVSRNSSGLVMPPTTISAASTPSRERVRTSARAPMARQPAGRPAAGDLGRCRRGAARAASCCGPVRRPQMPAASWHVGLPSITRSSTRCSSSSRAGAVWTTRPSRSTSTRSARPSTSGTSLETSRTARPSSARRRITAYSSARAPTSTPRVGSSSSRTRQPRSSQRARTAFCWLPPDRVRIGHGRVVGPQRQLPGRRPGRRLSSAPPVDPAGRGRSGTWRRPTHCG